MLYLTRQLYNAALQERIDCYKKTGKSISYYDQQKSLTTIRADNIEWRDMAMLIARGALVTLDLAYKAFFRRIKAGDKPGFPRFRGKNRWRTIQLQTGYQLKPSNDKWQWLTFKGCRNKIRVWYHRPIPSEGKMKQARLVKDNKGWLFQVQVELPDVATIESSGTLGIDVGIKEFLTTDEGEAIPNPRILQRRLKDLRREQRSLSRKVKGSGNRERQKLVVARLHEKVRNCRKDFHCKTAAWLVNKGKDIAVENLNIKGLARGMLSKQVNDVAWGNFIQRLEDKAEKAGLQVLKVNPRYTSQACSGCGVIVKKSLGMRQHDCLDCGLSLDRDHNAAINIKHRAGNRPAVVKRREVRVVRPQILLAGAANSIYSQWQRIDEILENIPPPTPAIKRPQLQPIPLKMFL